MQKFAVFFSEKALPIPSLEGFSPVMLCLLGSAGNAADTVAEGARSPLIPL